MPPAATSRSLLLFLARSDVALPSLRLANRRAGAPDRFRDASDRERVVASGLPDYLIHATLDAFGLPSLSGLRAWDDASP